LGSIPGAPAAPADPKRGAPPKKKLEKTRMIIEVGKQPLIREPNWSLGR
jgi:hypothetical protein